jgi:hypothetical protein
MRIAELISNSLNSLRMLVVAKYREVHLGNGTKTRNKHLQEVNGTKTIAEVHPQIVTIVAGWLQRESPSLGILQKINNNNLQFSHTIDSKIMVTQIVQILWDNKILLK